MHVLRHGSRRVIRLAVSNQPGIGIHAHEYDLGQRRLIAWKNRFDADDIHGAFRGFGVEYDDIDLLDDIVIGARRTSSSSEDAIDLR